MKKETMFFATTFFLVSALAIVPNTTRRRIFKEVRRLAPTLIRRGIVSALFKIRA